jgi:heat shock protein HtpX
MIQVLPRETVLEAQQRARRATHVLFALVLIAYTAIFNLGAFVSLWLWRVFDETRGFPYETRTGPLFTLDEILWIAACTTSFAVILGWIHFLAARNQSLDRLIKLLGAKEADPSDSYHARFINIVQEAELATGIRPIRAVMIPDMGLNAFSLENGKNEAVIGITEGLLGRLDRSELTAVISHEAAHLAHQDSKLTTTLYSLTAIFALLSRAFASFRHFGYRTRIRSSSRGGGGALALILLIQLILWALATLGCLVTRILYLAISRNREYLADAHAAQMCKDPLSLAEALNKIASSSRGSFPLADGLATVFIVNPTPSLLDEMAGTWANMFSTHPPVQSRMKRLVDWAKANLDVLKKKAPERAEPSFLYKNEEGWQGPASPKEMMAQSVMPQTPVILAGGDEIGLASNYSELLTLFNSREGPNETDSQGKCPRCRVAGLVQTEHEGSLVFECRFCTGFLLKEGVLERMIARREREFSEEEILQTKDIWKAAHDKKLKELCPRPFVKCPLCEGEMMKSFHALHTRVVIDRCLKCGAIWCDKGELEMIQMIVEKPEVFSLPKRV